MTKSKSNPKLILAFTRHGEFQSHRALAHSPHAVGNTQTGENQSKNAAKIIKDYAKKNNLNIHPAIHSSNLLSAWQSAKTIKDNLAAPCHIETCANLNERSLGSVANLSNKQIEHLLTQDPRYECPNFNWKSDAYYCLPFDQSESLMQSGERVANFLQKSFSEMKNNLQENTLKIMVGHSGSFRHAAYLLGILQFEEINKYSLYHAEPLFFEFTLFPNQHPGFVQVGGSWKKLNK